MSAKKKTKKVYIKQVRSGICRPEKHKKILKSLGFKRLNQVLEVDDSPEIMGQVAKIPHLVQVVENNEAR